MIKKISFEQIYSIWANHLWPNRQSKIEETSAMNFLGGYTLENMKYEPTFFGYFLNDTLIGVNSGHKCFDNSYRSRGVFVFSKYRSLGIGTKLLIETINQAKKEKCDFAWSYPRKTSWNTYQAAGYSLVSDWESCETSDANAYCKINL